MPKLVWDPIGERLFELGVKMGVLFPMRNGVYSKGVAWNGLSKVSETPSGGEPTKLYANDHVYATLYSAEEFGGSIEAYIYPPEFGECIGEASLADGVSIGQQNRVPFGLTYRTAIGNDTEGYDHGYKLHLIYGATASPAEREYNSVNDSPEANPFSWEYTTTPVELEGHKPVSCITIDSTKVDAEKLAALEEILYGKDATTDPESAAVEPRLPLPDEVKTIMTAAA